jgi:hypothetical protein
MSNQLRRGDISTNRGDGLATTFNPDLSAKAAAKSHVQRATKVPGVIILHNNSFLKNIPFN